MGIGVYRRGMPSPNAPARIRSGVLIWNQYTTWSDMRDIALEAQRLGIDSLWTWDHLYPIFGDPLGPMLEGYMVLGGWSQVTTRPSLGLMVGANTFRNPGLVVKQVTTLDHLSGGRAVLGIGAAWFDTEHTAFGIDFGASPGERLDRLDEAVALMRDMLDGGPATARGKVYHATGVHNVPAPVRDRLPILIGGGGERKTLRTVARYADAWNLANSTPDEARHKAAVLHGWCEELGRDPAQIEHTLSLGPIVIRDDPAEGERVVAAMRERNGGMTRPMPAMSGAAWTERCQAYVDAGFSHFVFHLAPPYDAETLERFVGEVIPALRA
jgi:alkanesulfonate monooxygenase SsuD/methylene tetrahydromethanopterin reductase-like flavin-dependent oxidoreductase (luciferase family)